MRRHGHISSTDTQGTEIGSTRWDPTGESFVVMSSLANRSSSASVKEGTKLAGRLKLGKTAAADPSLFIDWKRRLLAMGRAEASRLGLSWDSVKRAKRTLRRTGTLRDGHGGRFLSRLKIALATG